MFEKPLIGVAAGDDPYYDFLKEHIGEFHWSPAEVFALKYGQGTDPSSLRVICMIFTSQLIRYRNIFENILKSGNERRMDLAFLASF